MITPDVMNGLLANRAFRAFLAARTTGVPGATTDQTEAAQHVTEQIKLVLTHEGTRHYNLACSVLLQYIDTYLTLHSEDEPPYLPEGHEKFQ